MVCTGVHDELCFAFLLLSSGEQEEEALEKVPEDRSCKTDIAENTASKNVQHGFTAPFLLLSVFWNILYAFSKYAFYFFEISLVFSGSHRSFSEKELTENRVLCYFLNVLNMLM